MNSGRLRHRIIIQEPVESLNEYGETILTWSDKVSLWADVRNVKGEERIKAASQRGLATHTVLIRHVDGLSSKMRIAWNGKILEIKSVTADRTDAKHQILICEEMIED